VEIVPDYYPVKYGLLYNWYAATDARGFTSAGDFVVPSYANWITLANNIGGIGVAGGKLKEMGFTYFASPNTGATNEVGFYGRGSGSRTTLYIGQGLNCFFLTTQNYTSIQTYIESLSNTNDSLSVGVASKTIGATIRLVRPATEAEQLLDDGTACTPYVGNDGKIYPTVKIGTQVWTAANSCETQFRNGNYIPFNECDDLHSFSNIEWANLETAGCCPYDNDWSNVPMAQPTGEACPALELTFDDIANVPVADASSVSDWNTFFDLPTNGSSFTSVEVVGDMVRLIGGSGITIKDYLFVSNNNLLNVVDNGCVDAIGIQSFRRCDGLTNPSFNYTLTIDVGGFTDCINLVNPSFTSLLSAGDFCFDGCINLASTPLSFPSLLTVGDNCFSYCSGAMELNMPVLTNLGTSVLDNQVFNSITGQTITLTIPSALMTCNGGNPDGDIQYLQANNTVTIVTV
jgi:uncharacterized protein (TIGR02145 family)